MLELAQEMSNVSKACRIMGCSRQQFYEIRSRLLERFNPERERHIHTRHTGDLVAVDPFFVSHLKAVGKVYAQTAIDCHSRYAWGRVRPGRNVLPELGLAILEML